MTGFRVINGVAICDNVAIQNIGCGRVRITGLAFVLGRPGSLWTWEAEARGNGWRIEIIGADPVFTGTGPLWEEVTNAVLSITTT